MSSPTKPLGKQNNFIKTKSNKNFNLHPNVIEKKEILFQSHQTQSEFITQHLIFENKNLNSLQKF